MYKLRNIYCFQENDTIDPMKLKNLLKRSNATSLSEVLQKHNLSLADLLSGRTKAISVLKSEDFSDTQKSKNKNSEDISENFKKSESTQVQKESHEETFENKSESEKATEDVQESKKLRKPIKNDDDLEPQNTGKPHETRIILNENGPKIVSKRRFPGGVRRKLRLRPTIQNNVKAELSRDLIAQTARKYHSNRNITKSKEWKEILPSMNSSTTQDTITKSENDISTTTTISPEETTTVSIEIYTSTMYEETETINKNVEDDEIEATRTTQASTVPTEETITAEITTTENIQKNIPLETPGGYRMGTRRQPFSHRIKRKRLKQKISTTEPSVEKDDHTTDLFSVPNMVSSSEFIARTQTPMSTREEKRGVEKYLTTVDDSTTVDQATNTRKFPRNSTIPTTPKYVEKTSVRSTTEETAKVEIEEILNDTRSKYSQ